MKINIDKEVNINAPAHKVWEVLALNYEDVGEWATVVPESSARTNGSGEVIGRTCSSAYGDAREMITHWDEDKMLYRYEADGLPAMFKSGKNEWQVRALNPGKSKVTMKLRMEVKAVPGLLMGWMMKPRMNKDMDGLMDDLKHFIEEGSPHPKKVKSLEKWHRKKARKAA